MDNRGQAVMLGRIVGMPNGQVQAELMPGLGPNDAIAMCNTCIQALAARQAQLINAAGMDKVGLVVPSGTGGWELR